MQARQLQGITMAEPHQIDSIRSEFIEKVGLIAQGEGLPKTAGRMFGLFIFDGETIAFGDLADLLQVSRGSVSSSVRILEDRGILKRVTKPGERQDFFQLTLNPFQNVLNHARRGVRNARDEIIATADSLPDEKADIKDRIDAFAGLYHAIDQSLGEALDRVKNAAVDLAHKD